MQNAAAGVSGLHPVTYKQALKKARQVLAAEGISDSNIFTGDVYSAARNVDEKARKKDSEEHGRHNRHNNDRYLLPTLSHHQH